MFEITTDPRSPVSIKGESELKSLFPEKYEFLAISEKNDPVSVAYFLEPLDGKLRFDQTGQHDLVAYPVERRSSIAHQGPVHSAESRVSRR